MGRDMQKWDGTESELHYRSVWTSGDHLAEDGLCTELSYNAGTTATRF